MKKILFAFLTGWLCVFSVSVAQVIVFEYKGQKYYIDDIDRFFAQDFMEMCVDGVGGPKNIYKTLTDACADGLRELNSWVDQKRDELWMKAYEILDPSGKEKLKYCLLRKQELLQAHALYEKYDYSYSLQSSVSACVSKIGVHNDFYSCPVGGFYVPDESYLEGFQDIDIWTQKTYNFNKSMSANPLIAAFNGRIMVVCDNGNPVHLLKPTFSGRDSCKNNELQSVPGFGKTPDGVYLARYSDLDVIAEEKRQKSWGGYRIPLIPSQQTNTFDRTSMYLHGTTDKEKQRSAGCVSMGTLVDDFVDEFFKHKKRDMIIVVNGASQIDENAIAQDIRDRNADAIRADIAKIQNLDNMKQKLNHNGVSNGPGVGLAAP